MKKNNTMKLSLAFLTLALLSTGCAESKSDSTATAELLPLILTNTTLTQTQIECYSVVQAMNTCVGSPTNNFKAANICSVDNLAAKFTGANTVANFRTAASTQINATSCNLEINKYATAGDATGTGAAFEKSSFKVNSTDTDPTEFKFSVWLP